MAADAQDSLEEATCRSLRCNLTPLAQNLLWLSIAISFLLLARSDFYPSPAFLGLWSLLLVLFAVSWWFGRTTLACLVPDRMEPASGFAWEEIPIRFGLFHLSRRFAARDVLMIHGSEGNRRGLFAYHACIEPGAAMWVEGVLRLPRRGRFRSHGLRIASSFPFGLLRWTAAWELPTDLLAWPRLGALRDATSLLPPESQSADAGHGRFRDPEEFHSLKAWRPGMSQRLVHWKSSARRGKLMVREMQGQRFPAIRLELVAPADAGRSRSGRDSQAFEQAVSLVATLSDFFLRHHYRLEVTIPSEHGRFTLQAERGRHGLFQVLTRLTEAAPSPGPPTLPTHTAARSAQGFLLQVTIGQGNLRRVGLQRLDVTSPATRRWFRADRRFSSATVLMRRVS